MFLVAERNPRITFFATSGDRVLVVSMVATRWSEGQLVGWPRKNCRNGLIYLWAILFYKSV